MFRSATTRFAHNSAVPGLARLNKDLKTLQGLINAEKSFMQTLQKLAQELAKASEAVKAWGNGEGDDLGDTLTACTAVLLHWASAVSQFSTHETTIRENMKAIRTREENLEELKRKRKSLQSSADSADRKLSKMNAENKNFQAQADALNKLRDEIRIMDTDIMNEEANLSDFKRTSTKNWMSTKFGALMECCEKGSIVAEFGKLIIAEIPLLRTEPGLPRPYYTGHSRTELLVAEAQRAVNEVVFSQDPSPNVNVRGIRALPGSELSPLNAAHVSRPSSIQITPSMGSMVPSSIGSTPDASVRNSMRYSQAITSPPSGFVGLPELSDSTMGGISFNPYIGTDHGHGRPAQPRSPPPGSIAPLSLNQSNPFVSPQLSHAQLSVSTSDVGEFGTYGSGLYSPRSSSLRNLNEQQPPSSPTSGGPRGRFATFPVKMNGPRAQPGATMQSQYPPALDTRAPSLDIDGSASEDFSSSVAQALGQDWVSPDARTPPVNSKAYEAGMHVQNPSDYTSPPPQYTATVEPPASSNLSREPSAKATPTVPEEDEGEDTGLAYMNRNDRASVSSGSHGGHGGDRRVRFRNAPGVPAPEESSQSPHRQTATDATITEERNEVAQEHSRRSPHDSLPAIPSGEALHEPESPSQHVESPSHVEVHPESQAPQPQPELAPIVPEGYTPTVYQPLSPEEEKEANAAAAREVQREMDALMFTALPRIPAPASPPLQSLSSPYPQSRALPIRPASKEMPSSPTLSVRENSSSYMRQRDRSPSIPASPHTDGSHTSAAAVGTYQSPVGPYSPTSYAEERATSPPSISLPPLRTASPSFSTMSGGTPYRTPPEFPMPTLPAGPGALYNLPALSGSGTLPTSGRKVAAGLFKRQARSATSPASPPQDATASPPVVDVRPLNLAKRGSDASGVGIPRVTSASATQGGYEASSNASVGYINGQAVQDQGIGQGQYRSLSASNFGPRPVSIVRDSMYGEEDHYDYISAYVDDAAEDDRRMSSGGYGQSRFATNLSDEGR